MWSKRLSHVKISRLFAVILVCICFSNCTTFSFVFKYPIVWVALAMIALFLQHGKIKKHMLGGNQYVFVVTVIILNFIFSPYKERVFPFLVVFLFCLSLYGVVYPNSNYTFFIKGCYYMAIFIALTIVIESVYPTFNVDFLWFLGTPYRNQVPALVQAKLNEIQINAYSGVAFEKADAAYYMVIGVCYLAGKFKVYGLLRKKEWFFGALFLAAIFLTGKRMLLLCAVAVILIIYAITSSNNKLLKVIVISIISITLLMILSSFMPSVENMLDRFELASSGTDGALVERYVKWENAFKLFFLRPFFGYGYGSYNEAAALVGYNASFYVHNVYIELLADSGLVGFFVMVSYAVANITRSWKTLKGNRIADKEMDFILTFSFAIQVLILLYGCSGNVFFYKAQLFLYLFSTIMANIMISRINKESN